MIPRDLIIGDISSLVKKTNKLIDLCRERGYKIIFITHIEEDSDSAFAPGSKNIQIIKEVHKQNNDVLITKSKISPFYNTSLEKELKNIPEIVISGVLTNLCVRSLAQDAYDRDFRITIIKDCCLAFDSETHEFTLKDLKATREEIEILTLEEFSKQKQSLKII
jgi:nicotinamidase-related amidase